MGNKNDEAEARAVLNQGFLKILTNLEKYDPKIPFEAWIRRIMINTVIDEFRKYKKEKERTQYTDFSATDTFDDRVDYNAADQMFDAADVEYFVKQLPPVTQKVFNLYIIDGYAHKEIAQMLNISESTSKTQLKKARHQLMSSINKQIDYGTS